MDSVNSSSRVFLCPNLSPVISKLDLRNSVFSFVVFYQLAQDQVSIIFCINDRQWQRQASDARARDYLYLKDRSRVMLMYESTKEQDRDVL